MKYEWDEKKRLSNLKKHKRDFFDVEQIFLDIHQKIYTDERFYNEERYIALGLDNKGVVCFVLYTLRTDNIRIISFRNATKTEMETYYGN